MPVGTRVVLDDGTQRVCYRNETGELIMTPAYSALTSTSPISTLTVGGLNPVTDLAAVVTKLNELITRVNQLVIAHK